MTPSAADIALALWRDRGAAPVLLSHRENEVHAVDLPGGRAALRLHRPGYRSRAEIQSELDWCRLLAERGFAAPRPIASRAGRLIEELPDGQLVSVIAWMPGRPIGAVGVPLAGDARAHGALYRRVGALLAELHNLTDDLTLPAGFSRPRWDRDGLVGDDPLWGRYWLAETLSTTERDLILAARKRARARLETFGDTADIGLIHADALRENLFETGNGLALIDFDDCGFGYRMYDLASAVTQSVDDPGYMQIVDGLLDGYAARRALPRDARRLFPMFAMLRAFSALAWLMPRSDAGNPKRAIYHGRAIRAAQAFLSAP